MAKIKSYTPPPKFKAQPKLLQELTPKQIKRVQQAKSYLGKLRAANIESGSQCNPKMKSKLIKHLWNKEQAVDDKSVKNRKFSLKRKLIEALADHLAGNDIKDSALMYGVRKDVLMKYKQKFFKVDNCLPQFLEDLFLEAAHDSIGIFHDRKGEMSASQAAVTAGIFAERAVQLRKARSTNYQDESIPLATLQSLDSILEKVALARQAPPIKVIDIQSETIPE